MNALLTGSVVYGAPTAASDVDLVILTDTDTVSKLEASACAPIKESYKVDGKKFSSLWFGKLHIIAVTSVDDLLVWQKGTQILKEMADARGRRMSKPEACEVFDNLKKIKGA